jgi:hypothetical protein
MGLEAVSTKYQQRRKTRFEIVLHILSVSESQRSLLSMIIPSGGVLSLVECSLRLVRDRAVKVTAGGFALEREIGLDNFTAFGP